MSAWDKLLNSLIAIICTLLYGSCTGGGSLPNHGQIRSLETDLGVMEDGVKVKSSFSCTDIS